MSSLSPIKPLLTIVQRLGIDLIHERYRAIEPIGQTYGGATFKGIDQQTRKQVFIKYLIGSRGELNRAKFAMERDALKNISLFDANLVPKLLTTEEFPDIESSAIITEWVDGELLSDWLGRSAPYSMNDKLAVFARITRALSIATLPYLHRDFHPGNVMLLPESTVRIGPEYIDNPRKIDPGVKILDWGEALPVISGNYDDEPEHHFTMLTLGPRTIGGAFSSLPPEIFKPWVGNQHFGGTYEAWGMAVLLYRMLTGKDFNALKSIGEYVRQIYDGTLKQIVASRASELASLQLPGGGIIPRLFEWMCKEEPAGRAPLSMVGHALFDILYERLNLNGPDLKRYMSYLANGEPFTPKGGWKYRREFDLD
ncbi:MULTISPECIES: protein kinase [Pandoraea]|uniref:protein kinase domain-containing protein n=1 Tax=Pandoraea TaxID=93217 RepID=UPI001F5DD81F|nr:MULTISPECIES: protein kinase [Pandoraea]MCI3208805.1 hypothetical protein [Pandoraea sp. LA3]MDN4586834.1 hypothetical protein [Pandoraea capi]